MDSASLIGFSSRGDAAADEFATRFRVPRFKPDTLIEGSDILVEAANPEALFEFAPNALRQGRTVIALSVNGILEHPELIKIATRSGGRLVMPSGALAGLDAIAAAGLSGVNKIRLRSSKPPSAFPHLFAGTTLEKATRIFIGTAREAARLFPKNTNVAASLALSAFDCDTGPDRVEVEIWADPGLNANRHDVEVESIAGCIRTSVVNEPLPGCPATSQLAANSAVMALRKLLSPCTFM
jgi:aspartate dehydrogenase